VWMLKDDEGNTKEDGREEVEKFEIGGKKPVAAETKEETAESSGLKGDSAEAKQDGDDDDDDDDIEVVDAEDVQGDSKMPAEESNGSKSSTKKRSLEEEESADKNGNGAKRAKVDKDTGSDDVEVIELD